MILDTNCLSAIAEAEPRAVAAFGQAQSIAIPVIVLGEYLFGSPSRIGGLSTRNGSGTSCGRSLCF